MKPLTTNRIIQVVDYDPEWSQQFCRLRESIWPLVSDLAITVEHVGSTSVPGLAAKPVIDMDIVIPSRNELSETVVRLGSLGYQHRGNLGIEDREAFWTPKGFPSHNLYVCPSASTALRNHLTLRNHLRSHPSDVAAYATLKKALAERFPGDIGRYVDGKSEFILSLLVQYGFRAEQLGLIRSANQGCEPK